MSAALAVLRAARSTPATVAALARFLMRKYNARAGAALLALFSMPRVVGTRQRSALPHGAAYAQLKTPSRLLRKTTCAPALTNLLTHGLSSVAFPLPLPPTAIMLGLCCATTRGVAFDIATWDACSARFA